MPSVLTRQRARLRRNEAASADAIGHFREFDPAKFDIQHDIPVFKEHTVVEGDPKIEPGQPGGPRRVTYDRPTLEAICENQNARIRDTGDYTVLCIGHTPTQEQRAKGMPIPKVVGFAGPYYVAQIGDEKPTWAIIAKNWATFKSDADEVARNPRRSVEMYEEANPHDRYFDPIALLGAIMPHLDLGLAYSRASHGKLVRRYSAAAAASPSGSDTFVPSTSADQRLRKTPPATGRYQQEDFSMALEDSDIQKIVSAVEQLAPVKWAAQKMAEDQGKGDPAGEVAAPGEDDAPKPYSAEEPCRKGEEEDKAAKDKELEKLKQYARNRDMVAHYARVEQENRSLKSRMDAIENNARKVTRYARLDQLSTDFVMDKDEEATFVEQLDDAAFEKHVERIQRRYQRIPHSMPFITPAGSPPLSAAAGDKPVTFEERTAAVNLVARYQNGGKKVSFDEALVEIRKGTKAA